LPNTSYTLSLFVKKSDYDTASIRLYTDETGFSINSFNLASGTATSNQIQSLANGWFRVWTTLTTSGTVTNNQVQLIRDAQIRDGVAGIFVWGAQLETGSVATSYIPTVATTQTRNADVITLTGASALIGQASGTLYAEVDLRNFISTVRIFAISDGTSDNRIVLLTSTSNRLRVLASSSGSTIADISTGTGLSNGIYKLAFAYANNDFVFYVNGTQIGTSTSGSVPACSQVFLGKSETTASSGFLNDRISAAAIYPIRLTNAELAELTTDEEIASAFEWGTSTPTRVWGTPTFETWG
jgi:hypothetical protein